MKIRCEKCRQKYEVDDSCIGQVITCRCSNQFIVTEELAKAETNEIAKEDGINFNTQIMECPACKKGISRLVRKCPNCGYPFFSAIEFIEKKLNPIFLVVSEKTDWLIFLISSLIFFFAFWLIGLYSIEHKYIDISQDRSSLIAFVFVVICSTAFIVELTGLWFIYICRALKKNMIGQILLLLFVPIVGILICIFLSNQTPDNKLQTFCMKFLSKITFPMAIITASMGIFEGIALLLYLLFAYKFQPGLYSIFVYLIYLVVGIACVTGGFLLSGMGNTLNRPKEMIRQGGIARLMFVICFVAIAISVVWDCFPFLDVFFGDHYIYKKSFYYFFNKFFLPFWILFFSFRVFLQYNKRALECGPGGKLHDHITSAFRKN